MSGLGPWLKFGLIAWAISTAIIFALASGLNPQLALDIGRNLLGAMLGGLFMDWVWNALGKFMRNKDDSLQIGNPAAAHYNQGEAFFRNGDTVRAIESYSKALRFNPRYVDALISRGGALSKKGDYENAIADLSEALDLNSKNAKTYYYRGNVYGRQGDYKNAIADFDQALRFDPNLIKARDAKQLAEQKINEKRALQS